MTMTKSSRTKKMCSICSFFLLIIFLEMMFPLIAEASADGQTLGAITFKTSNSKRVPLGKEVVLYLTVKDIGSIDTLFFSSNDSIASCEKLTNVSVRVTGLKEGEVVITAEAGGKKATYTLAVGGNSAPRPEEGAANNNQLKDQSAPSNSGQGGALQDVDINPFESYQDQLAANVLNNRRTGMGELVVGLIGVGVIGALILLVTLVIFSNRSPKLTASPGSFRGFGAAEYRGKRRKRLLPDHYYRSIHKY